MRRTGASVSHRSQKKKAHQITIRDLSNKIALLEAQYKCSLTVRVAKELANTWATLLEELFKRARKRQVLSQKLFYKQGNKPRRLLARFTQRCTLTSTVYHVVDTGGVTHSRNEDIASQFHSFIVNYITLNHMTIDPYRRMRAFFFSTSVITFERLISA